MEAVAQGFQAVADGCKGSSFVVTNEVPHVFEKKCLGLLCFEDAYDLKENGAPRVGKAFEFARQAEWLARKTSAEYVKIGYVVRVYGLYVPREVVGK